MNSRTKFSTKKLESGFGIHFEEQAAILKAMIKVSKSMRRIGKKNSNIPFQRGIIISSQSLLNLYSELSATRQVKFILTSHVNQDALENFFSQVCALGGSNSHPSSVDFIQRTKNLIVGRAADLVVQTSSVKMEKDDGSCSTFKCLSQIATKSFERIPDN